MFNLYVVSLGFTLLAVLCSMPAGAQDRAEFKSIQLGSSIAEFGQKNPLFWCSTNWCSLDSFNALGHCKLIDQLDRNSIGGIPTRECMLAVAQNATYANQRATLSARFRDGLLSWASAGFVPTSFDAIVEAISKRYGPPRINRSEVVGNLSGVSVQNEIRMWTIGTDVLLARKYGANVTRGSVDVMDQQQWQQVKALEQRRKLIPNDR